MASSNCYFMLINRPTDGATCVFCVVSSNRQAALHIDAMFIMTAICISIGLYAIVDGTSHCAYCAALTILSAQVLTLT